MTPATGRPVMLAAVDDSVAAVAVARAAGESALTRGAQVVVFTAVGARDVLVVPVTSPSPASDRTPPALAYAPRSTP